ncbi:MAG: response regulator [Acidobacteria bacterium]|nr:response regulator [Acidobacteriota bacterium]
MMPIYMLLVDDTPEELDFILQEICKRFAHRDIDFKYEIRRSRSEAIEHLKGTNPYDIVLIDIVGVQYEELIKDVRALYPYLPISMFSRQAIPAEIIKCVDLGAQSFIFKLDLMLGARPIAPSDKWRDEKG